MILETEKKNILIYPIPVVLIVI